MSKRLLFDVRTLNTLLNKRINVQSKSSSTLVSAACVQRFPIISPLRNNLEKQVHKLKISSRARRSVLSDYELKERKFLAAKQTREEKAMEEGIQVSTLELDTTFEELNESFEKDFKEFKPQPRETPDDVSGNCRSLQRKLDSILYLIVKSQGVWRMPQRQLIEGQSLSQTAGIILKEECGSDLTVQFLSNTPIAYHYCPSSRDKVFFIKAQHLSGSVSLSGDSQLEDYAWVTKHELRDYLSSDYHQDIINALFE